MDRLLAVLLAALVLSVTGTGVVIWRAADRAHDDQAQLICLQQVQTTAVIAQLAPKGSIDETGRVDAMRALGQQADDCAD